MMTTLEKVASLIAEQLNKPVSEITAEKEVVKDLGADSLDIVELVMTIEEEFNVSVPEEEAIGIKTVGDIVNILDSKK
jgi:acyl carrier protein